VQLLGIDLRQMSVGQQHVLILPSSSLFTSSRMANARVHQRPLRMEIGGRLVQRVLDVTGDSTDSAALISASGLSLESS
jgi:flagellar biosynthesis/type III secretory pathway ATPase